MAFLHSVCLFAIPVSPIPNLAFGRLNLARHFYAHNKHVIAQRRMNLRVLLINRPSPETEPAEHTSRQVRRRRLISPAYQCVQVAHP